MSTPNRAEFEAQVERAEAELLRRAAALSPMSACPSEGAEPRPPSPLLLMGSFCLGQPRSVYFHAERQEFGVLATQRVTAEVAESPDEMRPSGTFIEKRQVFEPLPIPPCREDLAQSEGWDKVPTWPAEWQAAHGAYQLAHADWAELRAGLWLAQRKWEEADRARAQTPEWKGFREWADRLLPAVRTRLAKEHPALFAGCNGRSKLDWSAKLSWPEKGAWHERDHRD